MTVFYEDKNLEDRTINSSSRYTEHFTKKRPKMITIKVDNKNITVDGETPIKLFNLINDVNSHSRLSNYSSGFGPSRPSVPSSK